MGRKRQRRVLDVYVGTSKVGQYSRAPDGATAFRYGADWLALPFTHKTQQDNIARHPPSISEYPVLIY